MNRREIIDALYQEYEEALRMPARPKPKLPADQEEEEYVDAGWPFDDWRM